jgi:hypothetical protein
MEHAIVERHPGGTTTTLGRKLVINLAFVRTIK